MIQGDFAKTFTEFWTAQGKAMLQVQEQATRAMTEGMQAMLGGAADSAGGGESAGARQALTELWSAATAMSGELAAKLRTMPAGTGDETVGAVLGRIVDPRQWMAGTGEMDDVLGRMAEGPRLADLWEVERRYARVTQAWMAVRQAGMEHHAVVLRGWLEAGRRLTKELAAQDGVEAPRPDAQAVLKLWTEAANGELLLMQRSEPFLKTQREMIRASTELRMAQQELAEHFGKQYGFPTRTELDDVHRTVTELRRELRGLRRAMRAEPAPSPIVPAVAAPSPVKSPVTSKEPARAAAAVRRGDARKREVR